MLARRQQSEGPGCLALRPALTAGSPRMSKCWKGVPVFLSAATTCELKPHRGASGEPCAHPVLRLRQLDGCHHPSGGTKSTLAEWMPGTSAQTVPAGPLRERL